MLESLLLDLLFIGYWHLTFLCGLSLSFQVSRMIGSPITVRMSLIFFSWATEVPSKIAIGKFLDESSLDFQQIAVEDEVRYRVN